MGEQSIRQPKQQRSIEKRNKIIDAGYQLFSEKGYHNTNTAEIAKLAGVSTGIVYSYFRDKKDIFMCVIEEYEKSVEAPLYDVLRNIEHPIDIEMAIKQIITELIKSHTLIKAVHEEMQALSHSDKDIGDMFCRFYADFAAKLVEIMKQLNIHPTNAYEKAHICIALVEHLNHEVVYHQHDYLNYDIMTDEIVKIIVEMLSR